MFNGKAAPLISLTFVCRIYRLRDTSSPCLMMNAFCASENLLAFIGFRSSPSQENVAENSSLKRSSFRGSDQLQIGEPIVCTGRLVTQDALLSCRVALRTKFPLAVALTLRK